MPGQRVRVGVGPLNCQPRPAGSVTASSSTFSPLRCNGCKVGADGLEAAAVAERCDLAGQPDRVNTAGEPWRTSKAKCVALQRIHR